MSDDNITWLTTTDDHGNTVFYYEDRHTGAGGTLSATVGEGCTVSYEITASSLTENGCTIQTMDDSGSQFIVDSDDDQIVMLSNSGKFMTKESVTRSASDYTIKVTSTKGGVVVANKTVVIKCGNSTTEE